MQQGEEKKPISDINLNLESVKPDSRCESKCLVRFHNCTNKNVIIYWLDFSGKPIKYPTLKRFQSITINTYIKHLFFFRSEHHSDGEDDTNVGSQRQFNKVLAIPQEALGASCNATNYNYRPIDDHEDRTERVWVCPLCKYVIKRYSRRPIKNTCHHYSGEAKLSSSDLGIRSHSNFNSIGDFIYTCSDNTHHERHSRERRDIYLVESFYNLRERCFIQMQGIRFSQGASLRPPTSVVRDYIEFTNAFNKCKTV